VIQSDVYSGVEGRTFDRILAHPPYMPVLRPKWVYHDGGIDGEQITQRIVAGLPRFLRPGGMFQCHTVATDREAPLEQRLRQWLGEAQTEFDLLLVIRSQGEPREFVMSAALRDGNREDVAVWQKLFREWKIQRMLDLSITVVRHAEACAPLTIRRLGGEHSRPAEADWLLRWERIASQPQTCEALLKTRPVATQNLKFLVTHVIKEGALQVTECQATVQYPFQAEASVEGWMPLLLAGCNGRATGLELYERMRQQGYLPPDTLPQRFGALLAAFVAQGFITIEEFALPALAKRQTATDPSS
jgi:hypothetical protein